MAGHLSNKFLTLDIETFIKNNNHVAYAISFFDGINTSSYYLTDYKDSEDMIVKCISEIMIRKYDNFKIYIHNLSNFDANFVLKILVNMGEVKPIIHENKIISLTFKMNGYLVIFRDSQQLLVSSLKSLGLSFGCIGRHVNQIRTHNIRIIFTHPLNLQKNTVFCFF